MSTQLPVRFKLSLLDLAVLLYHVHLGTKLNDVGYENSERTLHDLTSTLSQKGYTIRQRPLEEALWSANLCDEAGKFWSPTGERFEPFVKRLMSKSPDGPAKFDRTYNLISIIEKP